ncbi:MAG: AfsR/SARP family transcriptional regulator [Tractidigestivibacter sp.]
MSIDLASGAISPSDASLVADSLEALGDTSWRGHNNARTADSESSYGSHCELLDDCRLALRGGKLDVSERARSADRISEELAVHIDAVALLRDGRISDAYRLALPYATEEVEPSLCDVLLRFDCDFARLLMGDYEGDGCGLSERDRKFLASAQYKGINKTLLLFEAFSGALKGTPDVALIESVALGGEQSGNLLIRAAAMTLGLLVDFSQGEYARVENRAPSIAAFSSRSGLQYISQVTQLIDAIVGVLLSDRSLDSLSFEGEPPRGLKSVADFSSCILAQSDGTTTMLDFSNEPVPLDEVWLLRILARGRGYFSQRFLEALPSHWRRAAKLDEGSLDAAPKKRMPEKRGNRGQDESGTSALGIRSVSVESAEKVLYLPGFSRDAERPVQLNLLGGFELLVDGQPIDSRLLDRRSARSLLVYLAVQPAMGATRYSVMDQLWPNKDYDSSRSRVYQATHAIRLAIESVSTDVEVFLSSKQERRIALSSDVVGCDVWLFERVARNALDAEGNDERTMELARTAEDLYSGDLFVPSVDASGYVAARREELRSLYADVMVAGAEAATRLGRNRVAARLADSATSVDEYREDAIMALVNALKASGRGYEAEQRYHRYALRSLELQKPSVGRKPRIFQQPDGPEPLKPGEPDAARQGENSQESPTNE